MQFCSHLLGNHRCNPQCHHRQYRYLQHRNHKCREQSSLDLLGNRRMRRSFHLRHYPLRKNRECRWNHSRIPLRWTIRSNTDACYIQSPRRGCHSMYRSTSRGNSRLEIPDRSVYLNSNLCNPKASHPPTSIRLWRAQTDQSDNHQGRHCRQLRRQGQKRSRSPQQKLGLQGDHQRPLLHPEMRSN